VISKGAERSFQSGRTLIEEGRMRDAVPFLRSAIEQDEQLNGECRQARYLSSYGLCLCFSNHDPRRGLVFCRKAVETESFDPDLWRNLGRVAHALGRRREAHRALHCGLRQEPGHRGIRQDLARLGSRRLPFFTFLTRQNPVNVFLGKLRASLTESKIPRRMRVASAYRTTASSPRLRF
jgi:hypothetical protein